MRWHSVRGWHPSGRQGTLTRGLNRATQFTLPFLEFKPYNLMQRIYGRTGWTGWGWSGRPFTPSSTCLKSSYSAWRLPGEAWRMGAKNFCASFGSPG